MNGNLTFDIGPNLLQFLLQALILAGVLYNGVSVYRQAQAVTAFKAKADAIHAALLDGRPTEQG